MAAHAHPAIRAPRHWPLFRLAGACAAVIAAGAVLSAQSSPKTGDARAGDDKKPSLSLKATPPLGFSPLRVHVGVDVRGGPDDYADFYCPAI
jgi:hypothetical protein